MVSFVTDDFLLRAAYLPLRIARFTDACIVPNQIARTLHSTVWTCMRCTRAKPKMVRGYGQPYRNLPNHPTKIASLEIGLTTAKKATEDFPWPLIL
jgi:hypothetical protein